jgi:membrane protease YdiL (CAAX protease family)
VAGLAAFLALMVLTNTLALGVAAALDLDFRARDVGDTFDKAARIASYADERLAAAATSLPLPAPPQLLADQTSIQILLVATAISQAVLLAIVGIATGLSGRELARALGLHRPALAGAWLPLGAVFVAYIGTVLWVFLMQGLGIGWLEPRGTVPFEITRSDLTLSIAAAVILVGAPVAEEVFFRGLVFGGLLRWGFWPAALISGFLFSLVHFDPGSVVPFIAIGVLLAWLYQRSGTLWYPILFHFVFNAISFTFLVLA